MLLPLHDHGRADTDPAVEIDHVLVGHPEASRGYRLADGLGLVGAVNAIERRTQIDCPGAERVFDAARHVARQIRPPPPHLRRRGTSRPFALGADPAHAGPGEADAADADSVAERLTAAEQVVEPALAGIDHDGARPMVD